MPQWRSEQRPSNTTLHHCSDQRTLASNSTQNAWNAFSVMELDGEGAANFEHKRDSKYARLEDKCNMMEQQVKNPQKNMLKRGCSPNHEETGASKKNKSNQWNAPTKQRSCSKSVPANNPGAKKDKTQKAQDKQAKKTAIPSKKSTKKPPPPSQNKSPQNPPNYSGKKKPPKKQQRRN